MAEDHPDTRPLTGDINLSRGTTQEDLNQGTVHGPAVDTTVATVHDLKPSTVGLRAEAGQSEYNLLRTSYDINVHH